MIPDDRDIPPLDPHAEEATKAVIVTFGVLVVLFLAVAVIA